MASPTLQSVYLPGFADMKLCCFCNDGGGGKEWGEGNRGTSGEILEREEREEREEC